MNTPNPLIPQGSLQQKQSQSKSTIRNAVLTIIAFHAVFVAGLLMQSGCGNDDKAPNKTAGTQSPTNNEMTKLDPGYYSNTRELPSVATNRPLATNATPPADLASSSTLPPAIPANPPPSISETPAQSKEHTIVKGDTLGTIAKANGVTVAALNKANPGLEPTRLKIGQKIQIPAAAAPASSQSTGLGFTEPSSSEGASNNYVVKAGDTLNKIASQHGTTVKAIKAANNLKTDRLLVGKKIKLPPAQKLGASASESHSSNVRTNILTASPSSGPMSNPRQ